MCDLNVTGYDTKTEGMSITTANSWNRNSCGTEVQVNRLASGHTLEGKQSVAVRNSFRNVGRVLDRINEAGFSNVRCKDRVFTVEQASMLRDNVQNAVIRGVVC